MRLPDKSASPQSTSQTARLTPARLVQPGFRGGKTPRKTIIRFVFERSLFSFVTCSPKKTYVKYVHETCQVMKIISELNVQFSRALLLLQGEKKVYT